LKSTPVIKSRFALLPQRSRDQIESAQETLNEEIRNYARLHARSFYQPYLRAFALADRTLEAVKKQYGKIFIDDVNKKLADQLNADIVPEVYFKLGDVIYHYLIDEFQDTSPIQWTNLKPLIENSLSQGGSLFVVGDTKQSIFGFRRADWRIMKRMFAQPEFPAARHDPRSLPMNYRSLGNIVAFNVQVFQERMSGTEFATAAEKSGLNHVDQQVKPENEHQGYVEVALFDRASGDGQEMDAMLGIINECLSRGYRYGDIAVLTRTNNTVVEASARLNQHRIPFLSYSSLDVRKRKVTGEVIALLKFLDSPIDDLSLSAFLLGDIFQRILHHDAETTTLDDIREFVFSVRTARDNEYLYKAFQSFYPHLWQKYFEEPYALVGYLPLYDLVSELYKRFAVFELCPDEEAAFVKVLEVVKGFEQAGNNSIKDFLEVASDEQESAEWEISAPTDLDAVQVMTVHKAKGLGFPVVIVLLYNEVRDPGRVYIIEEVETGVRLLRITKEMSAKDENLQRLYEEDDSANRVDRLNQLYVALTRAKQEMYVLGAYDDKDKPPISFLPDSGYSIGEKCAPEPDRTPEAVRPAIRHSTIRKPVPFKEHERLNLVETRRGEFIHAILAHIEYVDDGIGDTLKKIIASLDESMKGQFPGTETEKTILAFLKGDIREFFLPRQGRRVVREQEYCDRCGALFRVDRVIIDHENVTVIDYKTGRDDKHEIYEEQVRNYMGILSDLYPGKHAAGIIAYVDRNVQRAVQ
jgi:ATP-dependent exoDNAse (exonuclease V) beta subunit